MDDFLLGLYEEERGKIAAADLGDFMGTLPSHELEELLGLSKMAVAGPDDPSLPKAEGGELAKEQKKTDAEVAKIQGQTPPVREEEKTAGPRMDKFVSGWKRAGEEAKRLAETKRKGGIKAVYKPTLHSFKEAIKSKNPAAMGGLARIAAPGAVKATGAVAATGAAYRVGKHMGKKEKQSQGFGDENMGDGGGMETTAAVKADIAMRAMRVTRGAPPHIKLAAARFAGREMAKTAGIGSILSGAKNVFANKALKVKNALKSQLVVGSPLQGAAAKAYTSAPRPIQKVMRRGEQAALRYAGAKGTIPQKIYQASSPQVQRVLRRGERGAYSVAGNVAGGASAAASRLGAPSAARKLRVFAERAGPGHSYARQLEEARRKAARNAGRAVLKRAQ